MRIIDARTVEVIVTYDEPTQDTDLTPETMLDNPPLTDLAYTSIFYKVVSPGPGSTSPVAAGTVKSTPQGGAHVTTTLMIPAPANDITTFDFWVTATDLTGNQSAETHASFTVDRMAPIVPINFTIA